MDFWSYLPTSRARTLRYHFLISLSPYALQNHLHPTPTPIPQKRNLECTKAGWRVFEGHHPGPLKRTSSQGWMKSLLFQDSSLLLESQTSGTHCLIQHYSPFYPGVLKGIWSKANLRNINRPHLKILLQVRCLFVRCRLGKDGGKSRTMGRRWSSQLLHCGLLSSWCNRRSGACVCFSWHSQRWCL